MKLVLRNEDKATHTRPCLSVAALCVFSGLALGVPSAEAKQDSILLAQSVPATLVDVDEVRQEPLSQTIPTIGRFVAKRTALVAGPVPGTVMRVHVDVGEQVRAGQIIAELDTSTKEAESAVIAGQIAQIRADLEFSQAELTLAEQELARQTRLKSSGAFSMSKFETAQQQVLKAKARIARDKALLKTRRASMALNDLAIARAKIKAPFAGIVLERRVEAGNYLKSGDVVIKLLSKDALEIEVEIPSVRLPGLIPGTVLNASLEDGRKLKAKVRAVLPVENPLTRTRPVRFIPEWSEIPDNIAESQSVTLDVPVGAARIILTVHKDAIVRKQGNDVVYVVKDGKAEQRIIKLGIQSGNRIEVLEGLKAGEKIVVRGNERLRPGEKVRINSGS